MVQVLVGCLADCESASEDRLASGPSSGAARWSASGAAGRSSNSGWQRSPVDACRAGWIGIAVSREAAKPYFAELIDDLVIAAEAGGALEVVAIDMPIGLPDNGQRAAEAEARRRVGPRASSVFPVPVRTALQAASYEAAESRRLTGKGITQQAYGLRDKLFEVERWVRRARQRVVEAHPEVSFAEMAGGSLANSKVTWAGVEQRRDLLAAAGIVLTGWLEQAGAKAGVDDVLDAAAAAWTARRVVGGVAFCIPDQPQVFSDGLSAAIWV